jgi:hypothetical protein
MMHDSLLNFHSVFFRHPVCTEWRKKKLTCLICLNLKAKRAITRELLALHSVLSNLNFAIRPVHFRSILTERAAFKFE